MNSKKAKAIRKLLKNLKADPSVTDKLTPETTYTENVRNRKMIKYNDVNEAGEVVEKAMPISAGTISLNPKCERGLYKHLKSQVK
jgi:hypothetical protein